MFRLVDDYTPYRIIGIDPGTNTLGVSCLDLDLRTGELTLIDSRTFHGARMVRERQRLADVYGDRFARLLGLE